MKRILNRLTIIVVVIVGSIMYANTQKENRNIGEAVQVTSLPISGKVIVLDAGHGTPDEGAQSSKGTTEAESNLAITLKVQIIRAKRSSCGTNT